MRGMSGYQIKYRDNSWQVQVSSDQWLRVDSESDAYTMSACLDLMFVATEGGIDEEIAGELESAAALFSKYGCEKNAAWIIEHAKFARGQPSALDKLIVE
jgi:hypothetical protein